MIRLVQGNKAEQGKVGVSQRLPTATLSTAITGEGERAGCGVSEKVKQKNGRMAQQ